VERGTDPGFPGRSRHGAAGLVALAAVGTLAGWPLPTADAQVAAQDALAAVKPLAPQPLGGRDALALTSDGSTLEPSGAAARRTPPAPSVAPHSASPRALAGRWEPSSGTAASHPPDAAPAFPLTPAFWRGAASLGPGWTPASRVPAPPGDRFQGQEPARQGADMGQEAIAAPAPAAPDERPAPAEAAAESAEPSPREPSADTGRPPRPRVAAAAPRLDPAPPAPGGTPRAEVGDPGLRLLALARRGGLGDPRSPSAEAGPTLDRRSVDLPEGPSDRRVAQAVAARRSAFQRCYAMRTQGLRTPPRVAYEVTLRLDREGAVRGVDLRRRRGDLPRLPECVRAVAADLDLSGAYGTEARVRFPLIFAPGT